MCVCVLCVDEFDVCICFMCVCVVCIAYVLLRECAARECVANPAGKCAALDRQDPNRRGRQTASQLPSSATLGASGH